MYRIFLIALLLLNIACASKNQVQGTGQQSDSPEFLGFGKWYNGDDPNRITGYTRWKSGIKDLEKPIPFRFVTHIKLTDSEINAKLTLCGRSLKTDAKNPFSFESLKRPFEELALRLIYERNSQHVTPGDMLFSIRWTVADVPVSLAKDAPTKFCLVQTKIEVGEKVVIDDVSGYNNLQAWDTTGTLPPQKSDPLFSREFMYFVSPVNLRHVMEAELLGYMEQILPTLNGEITDQCGYFQINPVEECSSYYSRQLVIKEEALRCVISDAEAAKIRDEIERMENRLRVMSSKRVTTRQYYVEQQCP